MRKLLVVIALASLGGAASAEASPHGAYRAFALETRETRLTPAAHACLPHRAVRSVQETRVHCEVVDHPAHIGGEGPSWQIHEETGLVEEHISVDTLCQETLRRRSVTSIAEPRYWPEDDIWNPTPYEESGLASFNCADLPYDPATNTTDDFVKRIVYDLTMELDLSMGEPIWEW
ncbi:MAG: hypothetical protein QNK04_06295 [Myxococcota bacterium]|nr:hypothetical protein [Myxococcota bacterium]